MNKDEKKVTEVKYTPTTFTPSQDTLSAQQAASAHGANKPAPYQSKWQAQLDSTLNKILNREKFTYDVNADPLYEQYKDMYVRAGNTAAADTMAKAASLTGGYGNSYAVSAANQAYNGYMQELNAVVPELWQMALDRYTAEGDALNAQYALLSDADNADYGRWRDEVGDWESEHARLTDEANALRDRDFDEWATTEGMASDNYWAQTEWDYMLDEDAAEKNARAAEASLNNAIESGMLAAYSGNYKPLAEALSSKYGRTVTEDEAKAYLTGGNDPGTVTDETSLYGGYTAAEFGDKMYELAQAYNEVTFDGGKNEAAVVRAVALVNNAAARAEALSQFKMYFGDDVYKKYFGNYTDAMDAVVGRLMDPESYARRQSVPDDLWPSYEEYVITELAKAGLEDNELIQIVMDLADKYGWEGY